jgi:ketosteroid isomerase-like protein
MTRRTRLTGLTIAAATFAAAALITGTASATAKSAPSAKPATHGAHPKALTGAQEAALFEDYATARADGDPAEMAKYITPDMVWTFPSGTSVVEGQARGLAQVIARARVENAYGMVFTLDHAFYNAQGIAVSVHAVGEHDGKTLDVYMIDEVQFKDGKISSIYTGVTDVAAVNAYFPARSAAPSQH